MALPAVLSEKGLAKFRTKVCERLLASGTCSFGDRCQYSHQMLPRRNPKKFIYSPNRCSTPEACAHGSACGLAHTSDEEHFHPHKYKTTLCRRDDSCGGFYCPFAHTSEELRPAQPSNNGVIAASCDKVAPKPPTLEKDAVGSRNAGESVSSSPVAALVRPANSDSAKDAFWYAGDQRDLRVSQKAEVTSASSYGQALVGGTLREGYFTPKSDAPEVRCLVKLLPISRTDSQLAAQVVKEVKRWLQNSAYADSSVVRRTVATTVVALPLQPSTLGMSVQRFRRSLAKQLCCSWGLVQQAALWVQQLVVGVQALHDLGLSHLCLGPETVFVSQAGVLQLGDFLGKVKSLRLIESGWQGLPEEAWAIWYPPEVHKQVASSSSEQAATLAHEPVDTWQLGLMIFFLLTGEHPFGDFNDPKTVFANISMDTRVNQGRLDQLPLFADLVARLMTRNPDGRSLPAQAIGHPLLWSMEDVCKYTTSLWTDTQVPLWLRHLPALAPLGGDEPPPLPSAAGRDAAGVIRSLCDRALVLATTPHAQPQQTSPPPAVKKERKIPSATSKPGPGGPEREGAKTLPRAPKAPAAAPAATSTTIDSLPPHLAALTTPGAQVFLTVPPHMAATIAPVPLRTPPKSAVQRNEDPVNRHQSLPELMDPCHVPLNLPVKTQPSWLGAAHDLPESCASRNLPGGVDEPAAGLDSEPAFVTPARSTGRTYTTDLYPTSSSSTPDPDFLCPRLFPFPDTLEWGASDGFPAPVTPPQKSHVPRVISLATSAASGSSSPVSTLHGGHAAALGCSEEDFITDPKLDWCERLNRLLELLDEPKEELASQSTTLGWRWAP